MSWDESPENDESTASPAELARAEAFGLMVDDVLRGEPLPPAMDADDRELIVAAAQVIASTRVIDLDDDRKLRVIDRALEAAVVGRRAQTADADAGTSAAWPAPRRRAERAMRALPWAVASLAAAAAIFLFMTRPADLTRELEARGRARALPAELTSRSSDRLIGRIPRGEVAEARARMDAIWADRLSGYRALQLGSGSEP